MSRQCRSSRSQGWHVGSEVDPAAVYRVLSGERLALTTAERRDAVRRLERLSANEAARQLGIAFRTVQRHRAALRRASSLELTEVSGG